MITKKMQELRAARAKIATLENAVTAELNKGLSGLPSQYGFDDVKSFIKALRAAAGKRKAGRPAKSAGGKKRAKRSVIR